MKENRNTTWLGFLEIWTWVSAYLRLGVRSWSLGAVLILALSTLPLCHWDCNKHCKLLKLCVQKEAALLPESLVDYKCRNPLMYSWYCKSKSLLLFCIFWNRNILSLIGIYIQMNFLSRQPAGRWCEISLWQQWWGNVNSNEHLCQAFLVSAANLMV